MHIPEHKASLTLSVSVPLSWGFCTLSCLSLSAKRKDLVGSSHCFRQWTYSRGDLDLARSMGRDPGGNQPAVSGRKHLQPVPSSAGLGLSGTPAVLGFVGDSEASAPVPTFTARLKEARGVSVLSLLCLQ